MKIRVDIDGVICTNEGGNYDHAKPLKANINKINRLFDDQHFITLWTARGTETGVDWMDLTLMQLRLWDVQYNALEFGKPYYDLLIDDRTQCQP